LKKKGSCGIIKNNNPQDDMKEILDLVIKKEQEAKAEIEAAEKRAENIVLEAEKNAVKIIQQVKNNALKISAEMIKNAEKNTEKQRQEIIQAEKKRIEEKKKNWQNLVENTAIRIFHRIIDVGHPTGKLFD